MYEFSLPIRTKRKWDYLVIHHSLTEDRIVPDWEAIWKYHLQEKGWESIGYHFGLEIINGIYHYRIGRSLDLDGAHTIGANKNGIGILLVGNYDNQPPNSKQYFLLAWLCKRLMKTFNIPLENIKGHRDYQPGKTCPGEKFDFHRLYKEVKGKV